MGSFLERASPRYVEIEGLPVFCVTEIGKSEMLPGNLIKNYMCQPSGTLLVPQYATIVPMECMALMARRVMALVAEHHNSLAMGSITAMH